MISFSFLCRDPADGSSFMTGTTETEWRCCCWCCWCPLEPEAPVKFGLDSDPPSILTLTLMDTSPPPDRGDAFHCLVATEAGILCWCCCNKWCWLALKSSNGLPFISPWPDNPVDDFRLMEWCGWSSCLTLFTDRLVKSTSGMAEEGRLVTGWDPALPRPYPEDGSGIGRGGVMFCDDGAGGGAAAEADGTTILAIADFEWAAMGGDPATTVWLLLLLLLLFMLFFLISRLGSGYWQQRDGTKMDGVAAAGVGGLIVNSNMAAALAGNGLPPVALSDNICAYHWRNCSEAGTPPAGMLGSVSGFWLCAGGGGPVFDCVVDDDVGGLLFLALLFTLPSITFFWMTEGRRMWWPESASLLWLAGLINFDSFILFCTADDSKWWANLAKSPNADNCLASPDAAAAAKAAVNIWAGSLPAAIKPGKFRLEDSATAFKRSLISAET